MPSFLRIRNTRLRLEKLCCVERFQNNSFRKKAQKKGRALSGPAPELAGGFPDPPPKGVWKGGCYEK